MKVSANSGINANKMVLHFTHAKDSHGSERFGGIERSQQHKKTQNQGDGGV